MAEQTRTGPETYQQEVEKYSDRLYNEDLRPLRDDERGWTTYSLFATWMADVHSIGGYTFAAGLFFLGVDGLAGFSGADGRHHGGVLPDEPHQCGGAAAGDTVSGVEPDQLRRFRGEPAGPDPGRHRNLLVRHPDLARLRGGAHTPRRYISGSRTAH